MIYFSFLRFPCILLFQVAEALVNFCLIFTAFLASFVLLVVEANQVLACDIEAIKVLDCIFGAENILVDNKGSSLCLCTVAFADLSDLSVFSKDIVEFIGANLVG